jgi:hypothetical protein
VCDAITSFLQQQQQQQHHQQLVVSQAVDGVDPGVNSSRSVDHVDPGISSGRSIDDIPIVLCGDFNSLWRKYRSDAFDQVQLMPGSRSLTLKISLASTTAAFTALLLLLLLLQYIYVSSS